MCLIGVAWFADTVDWRNTEKIEQTLETFLPDGKDNIIRQYLPSAFLGFDKSVRIAEQLNCFAEQ